MKTIDVRKALLVFSTALALVAFLIVMLPPAAQADGPAVYYVQWGDTLFSISRRYGTTVPALQAANGLAGDYIYAGQRLTIPGNAPAPVPPPLNGFTCQYVVQRRDTLYSIAWRYGTSVPMLMQANYLYWFYIYPGMPLRVPCPSTPVTTFPTYTVAAGDNLFRIAVKYNTSIYSIAYANGIWNPNLVFVGQTLVIPYSGTVPYPNVPTLTPTVTGTPATSTPTATATMTGTGGTATPTATPTTPVASAVIVMTNLTFVPNNLTLARGATVLWQNTESTTHTVTSGTPGSPNGIFRSNPLGAGQTFSWTFNNAGTYAYFSELDQNMVGTIVVQ